MKYIFTKHFKLINVKILLIWSFLICSCYFSQAQTYNSSCIPFGAMETTYRNDACRLAIKRMHEIASPFADSITIPIIYIDSIKKALYAINNIQSSLVGDTLRKLFGDTNFIPGSDSTHFISASNDLNDAFGLKKIEVVVDNNIAWGAQWLLSNYNATSSDSVNYLINKYNLRVTLNNYQIYPTRTIYIISSPLAINAGALAKQFENISGVGNGYANQINSLPGSNGNVIRAEFISGAIKLSYTYGCGNCPSGCTLGRTWNLKVHTDTDCSVDYLSVENWGSPIEWLSNPCLDYWQKRELCPSINSTTLYAFVDNNDTDQWQVSTDGISFTNINDDGNYTGTKTNSLQLNNLPSSWYGNIYSCLRNGNRGKVYYNITFANNWKSATDSAWENAANWSCGLLPDGNTDVVIKTGTVFLNSDATVRTLTLVAGVILNIAPGRHLTILH